MVGVSDHTRQINAWIALCQLDSTFPNTLRRLGFTVDIIDPKFIYEGDEVNPDLILSSRGHNHSIIIDCKSKTLEEEQNERYEAIHKDPDFLLSRGIVSSAEASGDFDAEFAYSSFADLSVNPLLPDNDFAVVQFDKDANQYIIRTLIGYEFDLGELQEQFPISTGTNRIPTDYFPFDIGTGDADYEQFTVSILQSTVHVALAQDSFDVDDLLEDAHPLWVDLDTEMKKKLRGSARKIVQEYRRKGLSEHIEKVEAGSKTEWKAVSKSLQALQRKVDEFVDDVQSMLQQTTLDEDWDRDVE